MFLAFLYLISSLLGLAQASSTAFGQSCSQANNRLQAGSYEFTGDCDSLTYCTSNSTCAYRGCRKDVFPFGYGTTDDLPPLCSNEQFCPDEGDACQDKLAVGSLCQLNRDDECVGPDDWKDLADNKFGTNVNGSVCLNYRCMWANVTVGEACQVENVPYIIYGENNQEAIDIVSRGNCKVGLYCDSQQLVCVQQKSIGETCDADKECVSFNCKSNSVCGDDIDAVVHVGIWVYVVVGLSIFGGMFGTLYALFRLHQKQREQEREKRMKYWQEQNAFRENIMHMRDTARQSIFNLPTSNQQNGVNGENFRSTVYSTGSGAFSEDEYSSVNPLLHPSSAAQGHTSRLRHGTPHTYTDESASDPSDEARDAEDERRLRHRGHGTYM